MKKQTSIKSDDLLCDKLLDVVDDYWQARIMLYEALNSESRDYEFKSEREYEKKTRLNLKNTLMKIWRNKNEEHE